jgi:hypothetical protein
MARSNAVEQVADGLVLLPMRSAASLNPADYRLGNAAVLDRQDPYPSRLHHRVRLDRRSKRPLFRTIGRGTYPHYHDTAGRLCHDWPAGGGCRHRHEDRQPYLRAIGITAYLKNGGTLENAAAMANRASTRATQLTDGAMKFCSMTWN